MSIVALWVILIVLAIIASVFGAPLLKKSITAMLAMLVPLALLVSVVLTGFASYTIVHPTTTGVVVTNGSVSDISLTEGLHFVLPWSHIVEVNNGIQSDSILKQDSATSDSQQVIASFNITYHFDPVNSIKIYRQRPDLQYGDTVITPTLQDTFKAETSKYLATNILANRDVLSAAVLNSMRTKMANYHITVDTINLTDLHFGQAYEQQIEATATAGQRAQQSEQDLRRVKIEAQQAVAKAQGEADAIEITSKAIKDNGGDQYIEWLKVMHWNGQGPLVVTGGAQSIINLKDVASMAEGPRSK